MREIIGDLWDYHKKGHWVVITTNGSVRNDGYAVMGRGVAHEAAQKYPQLQKFLGDVITRSGNHVWPLRRWKIFTFPVKYRWMEPAELKLIEWSVKELVDKVSAMRNQALVEPGELDTIYMVRPGCGNGGLVWPTVKKVIAPFLDNKYVIVERKTEIA